MEYETIHFFVTGGTIGADSYESVPDKVRFSEDQDAVETNRVVQAVRALPGGGPCVFHLMRQIDSKDLSEQDLHTIAEMIRGANAKHSIITLGTDKMPEQARMLSAMLANYIRDEQAAILLTGSMTPLSHGPESDGFANLAKALEEIEQATAGVHVVMHGQVFRPDKLKKNFETRTFYEA